MIPSLPEISILPSEWEILRRLLQKHVPAATVWAFGSRARRTAKPYSDLDIVIDNHAPLPLSVIAALGEDLS